MSSTPALVLSGVTRIHDGNVVLADVDWQVDRGQHWIVLGLNGSGKTTLIRIASLYLHPSAGTVVVDGETLGRTDVRRLRRRIGLASSSLADQLRPDLTAADVVMTARFAALEPWWHTYDEADRSAALEALARTGCDQLARRTFGSLSSGERQRVQLARALMGDPALILLDEPTAALDLAGREDLVQSLDELAAEPSTPPMVLVTHHVEEIPARFTHVLMLKQGAIHAAGPIDRTLTAERLSSCFGIDVELTNHDGRWSARARG